MELVKPNTGLGKIIGEISKNKKMILIITLLIFGLLIAALGQTAENDEGKGEETLDEYKLRLEEELAKLCTSVEGVGRCTVTVSFKKGAENTYKGGKLTETKPPELLGVIVVCRGAENDTVRRELTELFTSLFDIPSNRVAILKLN